MKKVPIHKLPTGVPGLDEILGGGLPEYSFNLIAGGPGCGKTTLAHQIMFANAERSSLYITAGGGEPLLTMLRYQQQFRFFDPALVNERIHFLHLDVVSGGLAKLLEQIIKEVEAKSPALVFADSFRAIARGTQGDQMSLQDFVHCLSVQLATWEA